MANLEWGDNVVSISENVVPLEKAPLPLLFADGQPFQVFLKMPNLEWGDDVISIRENEVPLEKAPLPLLLAGGQPLKV